MKDELDTFTQNAGWTTMRNEPDMQIDGDMMRMLNMLKFNIPFPLITQFFIDFDHSDSNNIVRYFDNFINTPDVRAQIEIMKETIQNRQAVPINLPQKDLDKLCKIDIKECAEIKQRPYVKQNVPESMFTRQELLPECEKDYKRAPWMFKFTNQSIRGFVLKGQGEYTVPVPVQSKPGWYRVNQLWYKMACKQQREFKPDSVGYLTSKGDVIVETQRMFEASQREWGTKFTPVTDLAFETAQYILSTNTVLKKAFPSRTELDEYTRDIVNSFRRAKSNEDVARKLSYVLVFLTKLIPEKQSYHEDIIRMEYEGKDLAKLSRFTMLPEVYTRKGADRNVMDNSIERRRAQIENKFFSLMKERDPNFRSRLRAVAREEPAPSQLSVSQPSDYQSVSQHILPAPETIEISPIKRKSMVGNLAPGLFFKLRTLINQIRPLYCENCKAEVFDAPYITMKNNERLRFCTRDCFDDFDM